MYEKRRDNRGRPLKTGESQRKDLTYQYRYTDIEGKRRTIYSRDLQELREKETKLDQTLLRSPNYSMGTITVLQLVRKYISLKTKVSYGTKLGYKAVVNHLESQEFGSRMIKDIKKSDAKQWFIDMYDSGIKYYAIQNIRTVVKPAFDMAIEDEILYRNPFDFRQSDLLEKSDKRRAFLTRAQQKAWLEFLATDAVYKKHYDEIVILLHTGLRVSEFCGLTRSDLDFKNRRITVDHQLRRGPNSRRFITSTKTKNGVRCIPMDDEAYASFQNVLRNRVEPKIPMIIDGYSGFLFLTCNGKPKMANMVESAVTNACNKYNRCHPDNPLPHVTPHVLRHTFCTNMANSGMTVKSLQYLMGHAKAETTLDTYSHESLDVAEEEMGKIVNISRAR